MQLGQWPEQSCVIEGETLQQVTLRDLLPTFMLISLVTFGIGFLQ